MKVKTFLGGVILLISLVATSELFVGAEGKHQKKSKKGGEHKKKTRGGSKGASKRSRREHSKKDQDKVRHHERRDYHERSGKSERKSSKSKTSSGEVKKWTLQSTTMVCKLCGNHRGRSKISHRRPRNQFPQAPQEPWRPSFTGDRFFEGRPTGPRPGPFTPLQEPYPALDGPFPSHGLHHQRPTPELTDYNIYFPCPPTCVEPCPVNFASSLICTLPQYAESKPRIPSINHIGRRVALRVVREAALPPEVPLCEEIITTRVISEPRSECVIRREPSPPLHCFVTAPTIQTRITMRRRMDSGELMYCPVGAARTNAPYLCYCRVPQTSFEQSS